MPKHVSEIEPAKLDGLFRQSTEEAIAAALAHGVPVTGLAVHESGFERMAQTHPTGESEWLQQPNLLYVELSENSEAPAKKTA